MKKLDNTGVLNTLLIPFILVIVLFVAAAGFGTWAYLSRQDYKKNSDQKSAAAVKIAVQKEDSLKDTQFAEQEKYPLKDYRGPEPYGSLDVKYPKTWSAYVMENGTSANPVDGYFYPDFVPGITSTQVYALRVTVMSQAYSDVLQANDAFVRGGQLRATPFKFPKIPSIVGTRLDGQIDVGKQGSEIFLPLRDKTLKVSCEINQYMTDFNNIILPNLVFNP